MALILMARKVRNDRQELIQMEKKMRTLSKGDKRINTSRLPALSFILFLLTFLLVGCETLELNSNWLDREITVDGKEDDWLGTMIYLEKDNISLGLLNDENFMYICLIAENEYIRAQVIRLGFTLWFDPNGGKKKTFGIKFPIGMQASGLPGSMRRSEQDPERLREAPRKPMTDLEIIRPGKDESIRMPIGEAKGININVEFSSGMLVYELKVPLVHSAQYPYAVGAEAGKPVGIGLETSKFKRQNVRSTTGSGRGGMGGMRGRSGGRGMPGMGRRPQMQPLKVWATVQLASIN